MKKIVVNDLMQKNYSYVLSEKPAKNFAIDFKPSLSPKEMLEMGVFGGKYMTDCKKEFPVTWFKKAKLCHEFHDPQLNYFKINASTSLAVWRENDWIYKDDPRGWFQWYCRYYMGRRLVQEDARQIRRWKSFVSRHVGALKNGCVKGDLACRRKERQALLHWAFDSRKV